MQITFSPVRSDDTLDVHRTGDILNINGEVFDFSALPDGATLPVDAIASDWFAAPVERTGGILCVTLRLPHGPIPWPAPPEARAVTHPAPITLSGDGPVALLTFLPEEEEPMT